MTAPALVSELDHLVYATPDLDATVEALHGLLGVRAVAGGQHPGRGTRNALLGLGPRSYLELVGPDRQQAAPAGPRWFSIDTLTQPRLVAWAVRDAQLEARAAQAAAAQLPLGPVASGSRVRPDGQRLSWRFTDPAVVAGGGVIPFFIDWGTGSHPADRLPRELRLVALAARHPQPGPLRALLLQLGVALELHEGAPAGLSATLETPRGVVKL